MDSRALRRLSRYGLITFFTGALPLESYSKENPIYVDRGAAGFVK